jgi:hypothetical protein
MLRLSLELFGDTQLSSSIFSVSCHSAGQPMWIGEHGHRGSMVISTEPCQQRPPSGCCHVHVMPFAPSSSARHAVLFSTEGDAGTRAATRAAVYAELRDCPASLRTPQQIVAFLILRCRLFTASYAVAGLVSECLWLGDIATASALVLYMKGLEAMPAWTSRGKLERFASVSNSAGETLLRITHPRSPPPSSAPVPLDVCIITTIDASRHRRVLETIVGSQFDDSDRVAVLAQGQEIVPPSWGKEARVLLSSSSAADQRSSYAEAMEKMWVRAANIMRTWQLHSTAAGSLLPRLNGCPRLQVIAFLLDRTAEGSWHEGERSFVVSDFVKKNPVFYGSQISCLFIVPPSGAGRNTTSQQQLYPKSHQPSGQPLSPKASLFDATNETASISFETCGSSAVVEDEDHLIARATASIFESAKQTVLSAITVIVIPQHQQAAQTVFVDSSPVFKVIDMPKACSRAHYLGPLFVHPSLAGNSGSGLRSVTRCLRAEWNGPLAPSVLLIARNVTDANGSWDATFLQPLQSYLDKALYADKICTWTSTIRLFRDVLATSSSSSGDGSLAVLQHHIEAGLVKRAQRELARRVHSSLAGRGLLEGKLVLLSWLSRLMNVNMMDASDEAVAPVIFREAAAGLHQSNETCASSSAGVPQRLGMAAPPAASAVQHSGASSTAHPAVPNLFVSEIYHAPQSETDSEPPYSSRTDPSAQRASAVKRDISNVSVGTPHSSVGHDAPRRGVPAAAGDGADEKPQSVMMVTRIRSSVAEDEDSSGDDEANGKGANDSIQIITSAQAVESVLSNSSRQFQGPVRPTSIYELYVDPRWVTLGKETPSASSFEAIISRGLPAGTVAKNSFSMRLAALRRGTAYIEFAPQFEPLAKAKHRQLLLLEVDGARQLQLVKTDAVGLDHPLPQEHTFSGLKRGADYCIVHIASSRRPVEWISLDDLVVADGVQFRTPMYAVDALTVTEIYSKSASIQWEGNASNYLVTLSRITETSNGSSQSRWAAEEEDANVAQTFSSATGFIAFTSLVPGSLYRVQVMPQQKLELMEATSNLVLGIESLDGYFCTSIEPEFSNVKVRASCGKAIGSISLHVTHPVFDMVYPEHIARIEPILILNSIERGAMDVAAGRPVDLEVQFLVSLRSRESGATILEKRAGGPLKASIGPFDSVISVELQSVEADSAEVIWKSTASDHTVSVALAQPDLDGDYEEQHLSASGATRTILLQHLRPATDYIVKVSGKSCVNVVSATLRTLPAAPHSGECDIRHSFARRELRIALPSDIVTTVFEESHVMHHRQSVASPGTPASQEEEDGQLQLAGQVEGLSVLIKPLMRSFSSSSRPTVVVEDISQVGAQGVVVEVSKTLRMLPAEEDGKKSGGSAPDNGSTEYRSAPRMMAAVTNIAAFVDEQADVVEFRWTAVSASSVFTVGLGSSFLTVSGLRATFPLPRDSPSMFHGFCVTGQDVIPEDSPLFFAAPPPPPSRGLFQTKALHEDNVVLEIHPSIDTILDQIPLELRDQIEVCLEFDSPCFQTVTKRLPASSGPPEASSSSCVEIPLLLNRQRDASIAARFVVRNKKSPGHLSDFSLPPSVALGSSQPVPAYRVAMNEAVVLNSSVMKSLATSIPTPAVFGITNLEIMALQPSTCALRWASLSPTHEVALVSNDDFKFATKTIQPEIVLTDLSPQTVYHLVVRGSESGAHRGELTFCTPPELTVEELGQIADKVVVDGRRFVCELHPTFLQHVSVRGVQGVVRSQRRLLLWSQPPVEWVSNDHTKTVCTASLTRSDLRHGEVWPHLTVEGCCTAEQLGPVVCTSPSHAAQQYRIDLVGMVSLEMRDGSAQAILTWSGSANSYVITMRVGKTRETQIHRKMSPRHVFETSSYRGQLLYFLLRAEGPSNVARFSVAVPPEVKPLRVVHYVPTQLTFMLPPPQFFEEIEASTSVVVDEAKYEHSGASEGEESVTVQLNPAQPAAAVRAGPVATARRRLEMNGSPPSTLRGKSPSSAQATRDKAVLPLTAAAAPEPLFLAITLTATVRLSAEMTEYVCLNPKLDVPLRQPLAILKQLQSLSLVHVSPTSAELTWKSDDSEFSVEATSYRPTPLGHTSSSSSLGTRDEASHLGPGEEENHASSACEAILEPAAEGDDEDDEKKESGIANHRKFIVASPVVRLRNLVPAAMHTIIVRGRQCGDAVIQLSFLTPPVFHENSVLLRRHKEGLACSVLADFPIDTFKCGIITISAETRVDLYDELGEKVESVALRDGHCKFQLPSPLTAIHCVRTLKCAPTADSLLGHHLANADPSADILLAKIPKMSVMSALRLVFCEPNALRVAWGCSAAKARFTLTATPVASVNSIGGAPVPKRILTCDESCEASIPSLTPATLYEIHVIEDCSYSIFANAAEQQRVVIHDDAPPAPHVLAHAMTAPRRALVTVPKRYFGGMTISLNAERRVHQTALIALFSAIRLIPDNTVFVTSLPHTTTCQLPHPTLLTTNARPTFVTTNGSPGSELHAVDITLTEPAGTLTHRLEYFHVCEVLPESPYSETVLNEVQFSEAEVQPIELIRTIHKAHVTHATTHKMELQWEATNEKMRCDVSLRDLLRPDQPEIIHRVVDNRLLVDGLSSGTPYAVTITPSYYNVPCEPLSMTVLTAPKRPKGPKVNVAMLNAIFDIPATTRQTAPASEEALVLTTTHTALVICTKESDVTDCHSATDFLNKTQTKNVFKSADIVQRVDLRLRSGKSYIFVFFSSVHHPCSYNGILHSKPAIVVHHTDCYSPQNLHMVTRSRNSITVGWSSVDTGSKILRFQVEMVPVFAKFISAEVPFARDPPPAAQSQVSPKNGQNDAKGRAGSRDDVSVVLSQLYGKRADPKGAAAASGGTRQDQPPRLSGHTDPSAQHSNTNAEQRQALFDDEENKKVVAVDCTVDKPAMHCTFSFLQQGLTYAFRVRQIAADTGVASAWSSVLEVETMQPPRPVERLQVIGVGPNSFQIAWVDRQGGSAESMTYLVQCKAERSGPGVAAQKAVERTVHTTSCEVDGLLNATQYRVTVIPCNSYGESCTANNATLLVRTEAPVNWRI